MELLLFVTSVVNSSSIPFFPEILISKQTQTIRNVVLTYLVSLVAIPWDVLQGRSHPP